MKPESLKAIKQALAWLNKIEPKYYEVEQAIAEIRKAVICETPVETGKIDLIKWCSRDYRYRNKLCGIYHEGGKMIASDGRILCVLAGVEYPQEREGKIYGTDGAVINEKYVNYMMARPDTQSPLNRFVRIDIAKVKESVRAIKAIRKSEYKDARGFIKAGGVYFNIDYFAVFVTFLDSKKIDTIGTFGDSRAWVADAKDGSWAMIVPTLVDEECYDDNYYDCEIKTK
jgi:hypothetical protein